MERTMTQTCPEKEEKMTSLRLWQRFWHLVAQKESWGPSEGARTKHFLLEGDS